MFRKIKEKMAGIWNTIVIFFMLVLQIGVMALIVNVCSKYFDITSHAAIAISGLMWIMTLVTTILIGFGPIKSIMSHFKSTELEEQMALKRRIETMSKERDELNNRINSLTSKNRDMEQELETMRQTQQFIPEYQCDLKVQAFTVSKSGYVVKQEPLSTLKTHEYFKGSIPNPGLVQRWVLSPDNWQVFYVSRHTNKYEIGIDLNKVQYAFDRDNCVIYYKNVKLERLNRIAADVPVIFDPKNEDVNHTWIIEPKANGEHVIINDNNFSQFHKIYTQYQEHLVASSIQNEIDNLCKNGTAGLHDLLKKLYNNKIKFVADDENVNSRLVWHPITGGLQNANITRFVADLFITFNAINLYTSNNEELDRALIPEQISA